MVLFPAIFLMFTLAAPEVGDGVEAHARKLASEYVIVDTHIDVPYRLHEKDADISQHTEDGDFDLPRARAGGLDAAFMSIYTPPELEAAGRSKATADSLIDMVEGFVIRWPDKFGMATTADEVRDLRKQGKFALLLGMENGSPVEGDLSNLEYFYRRGVRYITLTHSKDNHICDSSYDDTKTWHGLSPFGREVVAEMNRLGIMIDVSHITDDAFNQVIELTTAPVIASHSSCRYFTPGFERNMSDEMLRKLAKNGGVIQINFGSTFISDEVRRHFEAGRDAAERYAVEHDLATDDEAVRNYRKHYYEDHPFGFATVSDVADHIDHVVEVAGIDHVGFGSDFDGVGDSLPIGLKDVSQYPNLIVELVDRGYSDEDIEKMCSGNLFRVMRDVERVAKQSAAR